MNKNDLVNAVATKTAISKKDSEAAVNAVISTITESLAKWESVRIVGFGTFDVKHRAPRIGRNPQTKEPIEVPSTYVPVFKAGKDLKDAVKI